MKNFCKMNNRKENSHRQAQLAHLKAKTRTLLRGFELLHFEVVEIQLLWEVTHSTSQCAGCAILFEIEVPAGCGLQVTWCPANLLTSCVVLQSCKCRHLCAACFKVANVDIFVQGTDGSCSNGGWVFVVSRHMFAPDPGELSRFVCQMGERLLVSCLCVMFFPALPQRIAVQVFTLARSLELAACVWACSVAFQNSLAELFSIHVKNWW